MAADYTSYTAVWSAVAATFSALSAFTVMRIQRRNLLESVRPDLFPVEWSRSVPGHGGSKHEVVKFKYVTNVGRGTAFNVVVAGWVTSEAGDFPPALVYTYRIAVVAPGESVKVDEGIEVWWDNIIEDARGVGKACCINVTIEYGDVRESWYSSRCSVRVFPVSFGGKGSTFGDLAPNLVWSSRKTTTKPFWRIKLANAIRRGR